MKEILLNVADVRYEGLKDIFELANKNDWVVVVAQRPLPSEARVDAYDVYLSGRFYAVGTMERFGSTWEELDAKVIRLVDNTEIKAELEKWVLAETDQPLEYWLNEEGLTMTEIAEMAGLPYVE